ncbi:MAG: methyl-accepting chemotaxis protein [Vicinamibacterales bacterium]
MRRTRTLRDRLFIGITALALLVVGASGAAVWQARTLKAQLDRVARGAARRLELAMTIDQHATGLRMDEHREMLAALSGDQAGVRAAREDSEARFAAARRAAADFAPLVVLAEGRAAIADVVASLDRWHDSQGALRRRVDAGDVRGALERSTRESTPLLESVSTQTSTLVGLQQQMLAEAAATGDRAYASALGITGTLAFVGLLTVAVVVGMLRRTMHALGGLTLHLRDGARQVAQASEQVSSSSQSLSRGATEQAASLEETSAAMEEMAAMTRQNAANAGQAAALMREVDARVQTSHRTLDGMVGSMAAIRESSDRISRIIKTIDGIAFQTNILALNAAVEAARAGDAGMGFAVVADEVRDLAQRSAQAARDTAGLIEESIGRSIDGSAAVQEAAESVRAIAEAVAEMKGLVESVGGASREQAQGIDQVTQAVTQMDRVTQGAAASAEESAAAAEELGALAGQTMATIRAIIDTVGLSVDDGATDTPAASPRAAWPASNVLPIGVARGPARPRTPEDERPLRGTGTSRSS